MATCTHKKFFIEKNPTIPGLDFSKVKCVHCFAIGVRLEYTRLISITDGSFYTLPNFGLVDEVSFEAGESQFFAFNIHEKPNLYLSNPVTSVDFVFPVIRGENGETYHALTCALVTNKKPPGKGPEYFRTIDASPEQTLLLQYYLPGVPTKDGGTDKTHSTKLIAQTFERIRDNFEEQAKLHTEIREFINDSPLANKKSFKYVSIGYLAEYWLKAYFNKTNQNFPEAHEPGVGIIAVVMIRRTQAAGDSRSMTPENLKRCLDAIVGANKARPEGSSGRISHVILYGDIPIKEALGVRDARVKDGLNILYLPSPFFTQPTETRPKELVDLINANNEVWRAFRGRGEFDGFRDYAPVEAKVFGIFVALRHRFNDDLVYIGFRSGTIDGAGFLGSPICYLDDTTTKGMDDREFQRVFGNGAYLYNPEIEKNMHERMLDVTKATNTFIRINIQNKGGNPLVLTADAQKHLQLALTVYICEWDSSRKLLWRKRLYLQYHDQANLKKKFDQASTTAIVV